ncbi:induced myeloid leukemia cell differentiation protein Mcl-1b [Genypterus blacodes]|uniref:induced myeloid leukemia cell differentiation protein Mcl-1b n=1 Tax=Genypterus blacodes TaxID=154954 RepID=UPI003F76206D
MNTLSKRRSTVSLLPACLTLPQNGVVEGQIHYGSGASSPQVARASTLDSHNGNVATNDTLKRPMKLGVTLQAFPRKNLRENSGDDDDDGSLPCTPESPDAEPASCPAEYEVLKNDTRQLVRRFLTDFTGMTKPGWNESKALTTMKRVVDDLLEKHRYAYNGMMNKLLMDEVGDDMSFVASVAKSLFGDGTTNWGRIGALVAFGAVVCQHLKAKNREHCVEPVAQEICTYLLTYQRDWLLKNNSWDGFVDFFRVSDPESTVRNTLIAFAGVAGIGATLALLIR